MNTLIRLSGLLTIRRVFAVDSIIKLLSGVLIGLSTLHGFAILIQLFLICRPLTAAWDPNVQGKCGNETLAYVLFEIVGLLIDLLIVALPVNIIRNLQMSRRSRWSLILLFSCGAL